MRKLTPRERCQRGRHDFVTPDRLPDGSYAVWGRSIREICPHCGLMRHSAVGGGERQRSVYTRTRWRGRLTQSGAIEWGAPPTRIAGPGGALLEQKRGIWFLGEKEVDDWQAAAIAEEWGKDFDWEVL